MSRIFVHQLLVECGVGIAVLVRCFVDREATENQITERLGDGFSRPPFATVVVHHLHFLLEDLSLSLSLHLDIKKLFCCLVVGEWISLTE